MTESTLEFHEMGRLLEDELSFVCVNGAYRKDKYVLEDQAEGSAVLWDVVSGFPVWRYSESGAASEEAVVASLLRAIYCNEPTDELTRRFTDTLVVQAGWYVSEGLMSTAALANMLHDLGLTVDDYGTELVFAPSQRYPGEWYFVPKLYFTGPAGAPVDTKLVTSDFNAETPRTAGNSGLPAHDLIRGTWDKYLDQMADEGAFGTLVSTYWR